MGGISDVSVQKIQAVVAAHYRTSPALQHVCAAAAPLKVQPWLFGGAIRDLVAGRCPRDLDIIVTGDPAAAVSMVEALAEEFVSVDPSSDPTAEAPKDAGREMMRKLLVGDEVVEVWHASTQRGLRDLPPDMQTPERIPRITFLSTEAVVALPAATPGDVVVHEEGFVSSMREGVIRARPEWQLGINPAKFAVKALSQLQKHPGFRLSPYLRWFTAVQMGLMSLPEYVKLSRQRMEGTGEELSFGLVRLALLDLEDDGVRAEGSAALNGSEYAFLNAAAIVDTIGPGV